MSANTQQTGETSRKARLSAAQKWRLKNPGELVDLLYKILRFAKHNREHDVSIMQHASADTGYYKIVGGNNGRDPVDVVHDYRNHPTVFVEYSPSDVLDGIDPPLRAIPVAYIAKAVARHPLNTYSAEKIVEDILCGDTVVVNEYRYRLKAILEYAPHLQAKSGTLCLLRMLYTTQEIATAVTQQGNSIGAGAISNRIRMSLRSIYDETDVSLEQKILSKGALFLEKRLYDDTIRAPLELASLQIAMQAYNIPR
ncbi:hypothetical protein BU16DRAFT_544335 [Lophium mytilinum]|uniref:Uncharacterized protein n=1 Tax=Lophium mytilinum TaxID=390894 RepID=A0A6A6QD63_9PEZI|nr:hypothetical protein BU16DRAFT_544335 [Lophium mytilinum]